MIIRLAIIFLILVGCGVEEQDNRRTVYITDTTTVHSTEVCTMDDVEEGVAVTCGGETKIIKNGEKGDSGSDGLQGQQGSDGLQGQQGEQGDDGLAGQSCDVEQLSNGALITCGDSQAVVYNGVDAVIELIDPCGDGPGFDEVLMRLSSGELIAYFESGSTRHLAELTPNSYRTTDSQSCFFTVSDTLVVTW